MKDTTPTNLSFSSYAAQTYAQKKDAVDFLESSLDPFEKSLGILIKKYAGGDTHE